MWSDPDEDLARPLEDFATLHASALRRSRDVIDLSYPNPRAARDGRALDLLRNLVGRVEQSQLQYSPFGGATIVRRRVAAALGRKIGLRLAYRDVLLTPGATAALTVAFAAFFRPDDEVLVITPSWMDYPLYLRRLGVRAVRVPTGDDKRLDVAAVAAACGPRTAGVVLSQPACPTGVVHDRHELAQLAEALVAAGERHGRLPLIVSDEVHRDQNWGDTPFTSPMRAYPETVSVYSFGKAWSLQGQRFGYLALAPSLSDHDRRVDAVERAARSTGVCAPTVLMQQLAAALVDLEPDTAPLRGDQLRLRRLLTELGHRPVPADGTAFVYLPCPNGVDDWEAVRRLAGEGLLAMPSSLFHEPNHFRLALNVGSDRFDEVLRRVGAALPT
ncbi:aminotransferase class I/II-fold pyridoxal phosphate-dependent enzyme [Micromonospora sp. NPDC050187]|uniref:aminotransferase class I/II-fold pyridoxal phosphate-dependent enzyme n=1 Tax=Micromonospora sp. NPDC050187 TaxID=3364277 RepID=UPI0037A5D327